jgi:hypothetical protein
VKTPKAKPVRHELLLPQELKDRADAVRGLIPFNPWVRHLIERECVRAEGESA